MEYENFKKGVISKEWLDVERTNNRIKVELSVRLNNLRHQTIGEYIKMAEYKSSEILRASEEGSKKIAEQIVCRAKNNATSVYEEIVNLAKKDADEIVRVARKEVDKIQKDKEYIRKEKEWIAEEKDRIKNEHASNESKSEEYMRMLRCVRAEYTRAMNLRREAALYVKEGLEYLKQKKDESEEIMNDIYKQSDKYMEGVRSRMQVLIEYTHVKNDNDFEEVSIQLKEKLNAHKIRMKERRKDFAYIEYDGNKHYEWKLCELALCYCDVLIDSLIDKVGKIGLEKAYAKMYEVVSSVEELIPDVFKFKVGREYIQAKKEILAIVYAINNYKDEKREERKLKLQTEREERQAQKELEAERKKAQKDMIAAEAAIEKNRIALELAKSEEEKQKYKEQVAILEESLRKSQERHERAISMAQQTRCGYVYVISNVGSFGDEVYKIGMTRRVNPMERVVELGDASVPFPFDVHAMIYTEDAPTLEKSLHQAFEKQKVNVVNYRKEYFRVPLSKIREEVEKQGIHYNEWIDEPIASQWRDSSSFSRFSS